MTNILKEAKQSLGNGGSLYSFLAIGENSKQNIQGVISEVQNNIQSLRKISIDKKFIQNKLNICSRALRESGVQHVGFKLEVPATVFGELSEIFTWTFDIEGYSDIGTLQKIIYERAKNLKIKEDTYREIEFKKVRMHSLLDLENDISSVFHNFNNQLNGNTEAAIIVTALAFYDMENLSQQRKEDYLLIDQMYNTKNTNDRWLACMNITANYVKPTSEYMSHLIH